MARVIGLLFGVVLLVVIAGAGFLAYNLYVAYQAFQNPGAAAPPPTVQVNGRDVVVFTTIDASRLPGAIMDAEGKLQKDLAGKQAFVLELTSTDLMALLSANAGDQARAFPVSNVQLDIAPDKITFGADVRGAVPVPVGGSLDATIQQGKLKLVPREMRIAQLPIPAEQLVGPIVDQALDVNESLAASGAVALQEVQLQPGKIRLVGLQREGALIEQGVAQRIKDQASRAPASAAPTAVSVPGADVVPAGSTLAKPGDSVYLALGDSLTFGVGVPDRLQSFAPRFHAFIEKQRGQPLGLTNLAVSGESTASMLAGGQLQQALALITRLKNDGNPATTVRIITLGIGSNDLLGHLASAECQADPQGATCQARLQAGLKTFPENFKAITQQVADTVEPGTQVIVVNTYNPFNLGIGLPAEQQANATLKTLNDAITAEAQSRGWPVANWSDAIGNRAGALTSILQGDVHPTALGYQSLAFATTQAYRP